MRGEVENDTAVFRVVEAPTAKTFRQVDSVMHADGPDGTHGATGDEVFNRHMRWCSGQVVVDRKDGTGGGGSVEEGASVGATERQRLFGEDVLAGGKRGMYVFVVVVVV